MFTIKLQEMEKGTLLHENGPLPQQKGPKARQNGPTNLENGPSHSTENKSDKYLAGQRLALHFH
jgi:hypothetical protein